jgi:hypothetical protein
MLSAQLAGMRNIDELASAVWALALMDLRAMVFERALRAMNERRLSRSE